MGKLIRSVQLMQGPTVEEVIGLVHTDDPDVIAIAWRDVEQRSAAFPIPKDEALRLARMLRTYFGPLDPFPSENTEDHVIHYRQKKS